jgi:hypothetical protein
MTDVCDTDSGGFGDCVTADEVCTEGEADDCDDDNGDGDPDGEGCADNCNDWSIPASDGEINSWSSCDNVPCGINDPMMGCDRTIANMEGFPTCDGGRCLTCIDDPSILIEGECTGAGYQWDVLVEIDPNTGDYCDDEGRFGSCGDGSGDPGDFINITNVADCVEAGGTFFVCQDVYTTPEDCPTYIANGNMDDGWIPFVDDTQTSDEEETGGSATECYCSPSGASQACDKVCTVGDVSGDGSYNVLDIVQLANCVLDTNCDEYADGGCAADVSGDGNWNVLDIVQLANCVLANNCDDLSRVNNASESRIIMIDNLVSIEADGFIGGVQMTLKHSADFSIDMTDRALLADFRTTGNETRLLVITPETDELFSYSGDFEIIEIIVANAQYEVSVDLPMVVSFNLSEAYPNPFNPTTTMALTMSVSGDMKVEVYNLLGQSVATLTSGYKDAGTYNLTWDASAAASGMYFVKAQATGFTKIQKLMLIK